MKKWIVSFFIIIFCVFLTGCDKEQSNRIDAINKYIWVVDPDIAPFSKSIKKQTIKEYKNDELTFIAIIEADQLNRIIDFLSIDPTMRSIKVNFDYNNMTFNYKIPLASIDVENGKIELNSDGYVSRMSSNNSVVGNTYHNNKIESFLFEMDDPSITFKDKYFWNGNSISKFERLLQSSHGSFQENLNYYYDSSEKLIKIDSFSNNNSSKELLFNYTTTIIEFNEHNDWIKAEREYADGTKNIIVREITYW